MCILTCDNEIRVRAKGPDRAQAFPGVVLPGYMGHCPICALKAPTRRGICRAVISASRTSRSKWPV